MESWIVRKKRRSYRNHNHKPNFFYNLPRELQIDILKRVSANKDLSRAMCVSKTWRDLIIFSFVPEKSMKILLPGSLLGWAQNTNQRITTSQFSEFVEFVAPHPFCNMDHLLNWCSKAMHSRVTIKTQNLMDSCNGLLLFFHKNGEANNLIHRVYYYYVINPFTNQCVAVLKPGCMSASYSYAALAYDPKESWFFKVVRFQGRRSVNVFSSETGCWTSLSFRLPQEVNKAKWAKKSIYSKGAIYRISDSGHLIKFVIDRQENVDQEQAVAIKLPFCDAFKNCHKDISVRHDNVVCVMSRDECLTIWELVHQLNGGVQSFNWCQVHKITNSSFRELNNDGHLLAIHSYFGMVFFKVKDVIYCYSCGHNKLASRVIIGDINKDSQYGYLKISQFPLLECIINFCCCLDNEHPRNFQRLLVPK